MKKELIKPVYECSVCKYIWQLVYFSDDIPDLLRTCPNCGKISEPTAKLSVSDLLREMCKRSLR